MKRTKCWFPILAAVLAQALGWSASPRLPRFEDFPAGKVYKGATAALKLDKPLAQKYAAEIQDGVTDAHNRANFAGYMVVAKWGCGAPCLRMAIIDAKTGEIYYPPITFEGHGPSSFDLPLLAPVDSVPRNAEVQFRPNSDLMIIEATPSQSGNQPSYTFYFLWRHGRWTLLSKVALATP